MFIVNPDDYPSDSSIYVLNCSSNEILEGEETDGAEARLLFLDRLVNPQLFIVSRHARRHVAPSAIYVGDDNEGIWFVGLYAKEMIAYAEIYRKLSEKLEEWWYDDAGEPSLDDPNPVLLTQIGRLFYSGHGQLLTSEEARKLAAMYPQLLRRFIQFYVWMQVAFAKRLTRILRDHELRVSLADSEPSSEVGSLSGDWPRYQFLYDTSADVRES